MRYYYSLKISTDNLSRDNLEEIIGVKSNCEHATWELEVEEKEEDEYVNFIQYFMDIIEDKLPILDSFGVERESITIWMLYAYNNQCNMEFEAEDLLRLGKNKIKLCISCWEE
ncbi:MAG: hypothetical protein IT275_03910 [Chitinophagales bacterium]|nr:hypothetical protein [Chitinophagales bacterium]HMX60335.1 hypothetical protein [Chitinophagales bacterium]HMY23890.1 hypothetical protein [Chitinophagales bacterium]HMZ33213.1 hypothetical protein [Chitinophagales bacterium]HNA38218.1 hypothetical protein [Chitinophagales bacterium]